MYRALVASRTPTPQLDLFVHTFYNEKAENRFEHRGHDLPFTAREPRPPMGGRAAGTCFPTRSSPTFSLPLSVLGPLLRNPSLSTMAHRPLPREAFSSPCRHRMPPSLEPRSAACAKRPASASKPSAQSPMSTGHRSRRSRTGSEIQAGRRSSSSPLRWGWIWETWLGSPPNSRGGLADARDRRRSPPKPGDRAWIKVGKGDRRRGRRRASVR